MLVELGSRMFLSLLFLAKPSFSFSSEEIGEYDKIFEQAMQSSDDGTCEIEYNSRFPKYRFIQYICENKDVVMHGSNNGTISTFEPRQQTLYNGQLTEAVFASKDGIWPLFYAVLDKSKIVGNIRNGCLETSHGKKYYFFSLTKETLENNPWTSGMIYFLPQQTFHRSGKGKVSFDEWVSEDEVRPIAKMPVDSTDFYFLSKVQVHKQNEHVVATWLQYKWRLIFQRR